MKTTNKPRSFHNFAAASAVGFCLLFSAGFLRAETSPGDDTSPTNTRDTTGIVTAYSPGVSITVKGQKAAFAYQAGRDMRIIGPDGKPLDAKMVRRGEKVTVYYYRRDGSPTVSRLVVLDKRAAKGS